MADLIGLRVCPGACVVLMSAALAALAGCTAAEAPPPLSSHGQAALTAGRGPIDTGTFPNLNVPQHAAAQQFSTDERDAKLTALRAEQRRQVPGAVETPEQRRRRLQLLADEQEETLEVIENN